jgi:hypothetical protein
MTNEQAEIEFSIELAKSMFAATCMIGFRIKKIYRKG